MYCPKCSQQQVSEEVRFCSRCGFLLTGVAEVVKNDGRLPGITKQGLLISRTLRKKGFKHGLFALLFLILTSPVLLGIGKTISLHPGVMVMIMFILFISCVIKMIYAVMFEPDEPLAAESADSQSANILLDKNNAAALPPAQTNPIADFASPMHGKWRDSNELVFSSVTDVTTKQLDKK